MAMRATASCTKSRALGAALVVRMIDATHSACDEERNAAWVAVFRRFGRGEMIR